MKTEMKNEKYLIEINDITAAIIVESEDAVMDILLVLESLFDNNEEAAITYFGLVSLARRVMQLKKLHDEHIEIPLKMERVKRLKELEELLASTKPMKEEGKK